MPSYTHLPVISVSHTSNPFAGLEIATFWALVIRGGKKPLVVLDASNIADATGSEVVPAAMPPDALTMLEYSNAVAAALTLTNCFVVPNDPSPVPPLETASVPAHPKVSEADCSKAFEGSPPKVSVTLVSSVLLNTPAAVNDGAVDPAVLLPKYVFAPAFESANVSAGVVVAVPTLLVNSGERLPALKDVTVPAARYVFISKAVAIHVFVRSKTVIFVVSAITSCAIAL